MEAIPNREAVSIYFNDSNVSIQITVTFTLAYVMLYYGTFVFDRST